MTPPVVEIVRIGEGKYLVKDGERQEIVYAAGSSSARWIFWNGRTYLLESGGRDQRAPTSEAGGPMSITAPMPARVTRIMVKPGAPVRKGDTLLVLEAMKMEQPIRAHADAVVTAVHCGEGDLVQAEAVLMDLA